MIIIHKIKGETPLQALNRLRSEKVELKNAKLSYAGRLDPIAEGLMLVLVDDENKKRDKYLCLDKQYIAGFLLGIGTDTYDILGKIKKVHTEQVKPIEVMSFIRALTHIKGEALQEYPPYSSKTVHGKPLFKWARELNSKLIQIKIPSKKITVHDVKIIGISNYTDKELLLNVKKTINSVNGDFRQTEILSHWQKNLQEKENKNKKTHIVVYAKLNVSSGTYIRGIANTIGQSSGVHATVFSLIRTQIGSIHSNSL